MKRPTALPLVLLCLGACNGLAGLDSLSFRDEPAAEVVCAPGETRACYNGPSGTLGVGACAAGVAPCRDDGTGFGACVGEVLPTTESCDAPGDEDCNGQLNDDCACSPGDTLACYSGPAGTLDVGACHAGTQTCLEGGSGYGPCTGEVLPTLEVCLSEADEDCDAAPECGSVTAGAAFGDGSAQFLRGLGGGPQGEIAFAGQLQGQIAFGADVLTGSASGDALAGLRLAPQTFGFAASYGSGAFADVGEDAAIADDGSVYLVGSASGLIDLGTGPLVPAGLAVPDAFIARIGGPAGGAWATLLGDAASQTANAVAIAPNGTIAMVGDQDGSIALGMTTLDALGTDGFLVGWDPDGAPSFALGLGGAKIQRALDVAFDGVSRPVFVGAAEVEVDLEGNATPLGKMTGAYVVARTLGGGPRWMVHDASSDGYSVANAVATSASTGEIYVAGSFQGSVSFGTCEAISSGGTNLFVLRLSAPGECISLYTSAGTGTQEATGLAADPQGNVYVVGRFQGESDFGGGVLDAADWDGFVLALSGSQRSWVKVLGGAGDAAPEDVVVTPTGTVVVGGSFQGSLEWPRGMLTSAGDWDIFLLDLAP